MTSQNEQILASLTQVTDPYLSCDDCFALIDQYVELLTADPGHRDERMQTHLAGCGACAEEADAILELLSAEH